MGSLVAPFFYLEKIMSDVKLIRMSSGEDVVATIVHDSETRLVVKDAIVAVPTTAGQIGFAPWSPIISKEDKEIPVSKNFIVYITNVDSKVKEQYDTMYGNIVTPAKQNIIV